jgi:hypothetical protein
MNINKRHVIIILRKYSYEHKDVADVFKSARRLGINMVIDFVVPSLSRVCPKVSQISDELVA